MVQITFEKFTIEETGSSSGYADFENLRVVAEKSASRNGLQKALAQHPLPDITACISMEDGVPILRYAGWRVRSERGTCSASVHGTYLGKADTPTWPGHHVIRVAYRNRSARTGTTYEGVIPVHIPESLIGKLPEEGESIKVVGWPVPNGTTTRVTDTGQSEPWPDLRIVGSALHNGRGWFHRDGVLSMVPSGAIHHCAKCDRELPAEAFYVKSNGKLRRPCRECILDRQRQYDAEHRVEGRERHREHAARSEVRERVNARRRQSGRRDRYASAGIPGVNMPEHRWAVIVHRGRLGDHEVVHHIDGNPVNNAIENLSVFESQSDHKAHEKGVPVDPVWRGDECACPRCAGGLDGKAA